jgi:hypothetical protein
MNAVSPGANAAFIENMLEQHIGKVYAGRGGQDGYLWTDPAPTPVVVKPEMVNHPRHYNAHPSGVECIEINEHMTANLAAAFKYGWRYGDKGDPVENLEKMLWYVRRSVDHDNAYLLANPLFHEFFRTEVMTPERRRAFSRPSPWCEPVRHAMAAICDIHCTRQITERIRLYDKTIACIETAIKDEQCLGRGMEP